MLAIGALCMFLAALVTPCQCLCRSSRSCEAAIDKLLEAYICHDVHDQVNLLSGQPVYRSQAACHCFAACLRALAGLQQVILLASAKVDLASISQHCLSWGSALVHVPLASDNIVSPGTCRGLPER